MPTIFIRVMLFFCSYFPLTMIICVLQYDVWPWWITVLVAGVPGLGSLALTWVYFQWMRRKAYVEQKKIIGFSRHDSEVMGYIASYLVPFVTFPLGYVKQIVTLLIFVAVLLVVYVRSNMIYINPVLSICGYHLYEVEVEHSQRTHYYIARKRIERNREIRFVQLSDDIYLEK
jgi:hypothetical protein